MNREMFHLVSQFEFVKRKLTFPSLNRLMADIVRLQLIEPNLMDNGKSS